MDLRPMLAESVTVKHTVGVPKAATYQAFLAKYFQDDDWNFEQKVDGHRKLIIVTDGDVTVLNRSGDNAALPRPIVDDFANLGGGPWAFDGELVDNRLHIFDTPQAATLITPQHPFHERRALLERIFDIWQPTVVKLLPTARTPDEKETLAKRLIDGNAEGVMMRHRNGTYESGRRSRRLLKVKFCQDVDCFVTGVNVGGKDNFAVSVWDGTKKVEIGEVTSLSKDGARIVAQYLRWEAGEPGATQPVVCVKYLYALESNRRLVQPTFPRLRDDKPSIECTIDQLHFTNKEVLA